MDWADDVAYSVHDVEDGIHGGYLSLRPLLDVAPDARDPRTGEPLAALPAARAPLRLHAPDAASIPIE